MKTYIIVNASLDNAIGYKNDLIYKIPDDLRRFKSLTTNQSIIMGSRTFESIGKTPLPNRQNIVITRYPEKYEALPNLHFAKDIDEALSLVDRDEAFFIGGENIFKETIERNLIDKIYLTRVHENAKNADTYLPDISAFTIESQTDIVDYPLLNISYNFINYIKC